jgi:hypothetical protein
MIISKLLINVYLKCHLYIQILELSEFNELIMNFDRSKCIFSLFLTLNVKFEIYQIQSLKNLRFIWIFQINI